MGKVGGSGYEDRIRKLMDREREFTAAGTQRPGLHLPRLPSGPLPMSVYAPGIPRQQAV